MLLPTLHGRSQITPTLVTTKFRALGHSHHEVGIWCTLLLGVRLQEEVMAVMDRIDHAGSKKLPAIDGGGIRGVLALEVLQRIEDLLKAKSKRTNLHLADYFDYIAGTSTGGIIADGLSIGMSVTEI